MTGAVNRGSVIVLASGDAPRAHIHGATSPELIRIVVLMKSRRLRLLINRCISAAKAAGIDRSSVLSLSQKNDFPGTCIVASELQRLVVFQVQAGRNPLYRA